MRNPSAPPGNRTVPRNRRFAALRSIIALMMREMATEHGRNPGGYIWAVLQPLAGIMIMVLLFQIGLRVRSPSLGSSFGLFFASGMVPFMAWRQVSQQMSTALRYSSAFLAYPPVTLVDALAARFILNSFTHLLVGYILYAFFLSFYDTGAYLNLPGMALGCAMFMVLILGVGIMNAFLTGVFPVWNQAWTVITRPLFLISGVFFLYEDMPLPIRDWLWWNPLTHAIGQIRKATYHQYDALWVSPFYVFTIGLVLTLFGLLLLEQYKFRILHEM